MRTRFVLFDIDGTLVRIKRQFMNELISQLMRRSGREEVVLSDQSFAGRTDRDIFSKLLSDNGFPSNQFDEFRELYVQTLEELLTPDDLEALPGAKEAVEFTLGSGHLAGLLTGNFREAAFTKLNRAGLDGYFSMGAFGCDYKERNRLPEVAYELGKMLIGSSFQPEDMIIIGDTPNDIACARHFGCISVSVATGPFTSAQLKEHGPDISLDTLHEPEEWMGGLTSH